MFSGDFIGKIIDTCQGGTVAEKRFSFLLVHGTGEKTTPRHEWELGTVMGGLLPKGWHGGAIGPAQPETPYGVDPEDIEDGGAGRYR